MLLFKTIFSLKVCSFCRCILSNFVQLSLQASNYLVKFKSVVENSFKNPSLLLDELF